jgi:hypothetical protein
VALHVTTGYCPLPLHVTTGCETTVVTTVQYLIVALMI